MLKDLERLVGENEFGIKLTIHKMCESKDKRMGKQFEQKAWAEIIYDTINKKITTSKASFCVNITTIQFSNELKSYKADNIIGNEIVLKCLKLVEDSSAIRLDIRKNSDGPKSKESFIIIRY